MDPVKLVKRVRPGILSDLSVGSNVSFGRRSGTVPCIGCMLLLHINDVADVSVCTGRHRDTQPAKGSGQTSGEGERVVESQISEVLGPRPGDEVGIPRDVSADSGRERNGAASRVWES
jgi:hypothetical protein